jgi:hypothetical protein
MALLLTIGVVGLLLIVRLSMPPVPGLLKMSFDRLGKRTTIMLCTVAFICALLLIAVTRRL